jgi:hypothetical protein
MSNKDDELAALKARVEELERLAQPPPPPPDPRSFPRYDPTARMSMPASALREMARAVPDAVIRDVALRDCRAPTGPSGEGVVPSGQQVSSVHPGPVAPINKTGWVEPAPIGPVAGIKHVDRLMDEQDRRDREAARRGKQ